MDRQTLINTACELPAINAAAAKEYEAKATLMAGKVTSVLAQRADIVALVGPDNLLMMEDNHANHARFIGSILKKMDAEILTDTILWMFRAYRSHGFSSHYRAAQLNAWIKTLHQEHSAEAYHGIYPLYEWMQINIPMFTLVSETQLNEITLNH